jgi:hypothetical protein
MFKETSDGQTHYYNDGCGCPEHNNMPDPTKIKDQLKDWEDDYKEKFGLCNKDGKCDCKEELKFISDLLAEKDREIKKLITDEMVIAQKEGQPTSRLTSLYNKL